MPEKSATCSALVPDGFMKKMRSPGRRSDTSSGAALQGELRRERRRKSGMNLKKFRTVIIDKRLTLFYPFILK